MKILINTPRLIPQGGVANHYIGLKDYWTEEVLYNPIGKKGSVSGSGVFKLPWDIVVFVYKILSFRPDIILLNPSLSKSAVVRDMIFLRIAILFRKKVAVFFHGFNVDNLVKMNTRSLSQKLNKCKCVFVLANEFAERLRNVGVSCPIHLTTTKVDDKLVSNFDVKEKTGIVRNILFLARIHKHKGIFIALDAFKLLQEKYPNLQFRIVGNGPALKEAEQMVLEKHIPHVCFVGALSGDKLIHEYANADLYLFPTYHHEGMPTSVLEAMAFGLPVFSRKVGGLNDFFENDKMGYITDSLNPVDFANAMMPYIENSSLTKEVANYNSQYACSHFMASRVAKQLEAILKMYV